MDSRVARKLIRTTEALGAAGELAGVWLFTRMRANMSCLVLQTVERAIAEGALVRAGKILTHFFGRRPGTLHERRK